MFSKKSYLSTRNLSQSKKLADKTHLDVIVVARRVSRVIFQKFVTIKEVFVLKKDNIILALCEAMNAQKKKKEEVFVCLCLILRKEPLSG